MPKLLIVAGVVLILVGLAWLLGERLGLGRLPGDIVIERGDLRLYIPITTSLVVSLALSAAFWFSIDDAPSSLKGSSMAHEHAHHHPP